MFDLRQMEWTQQVSYRYEFAVPLSIPLLYDALYQFCSLCGEVPEYLFLPDEDLRRLSREPEAILHRMVDPSANNPYAMMTLANPLGNKPIRLIPMPELPQRTAILGFFGGREEYSSRYRPPVYYYREQGPVITTEEVEVPHVDE